MLVRSIVVEMAGAARLELSTTTAASAAFHRHLGLADVSAPEFELFPFVICASTCLGIDAEALRAAPSSPGLIRKS